MDKKNSSPYSIYELDGAQDAPKGWEAIEIPVSIQEDFSLPHPEVFNFDKRDNPEKNNEGSPYYEYYTQDKDTEYERDEFRDNYKDQTLLNDSNKGIFIKGDEHTERVKRMVSRYILNTKPVKLEYDLDKKELKNTKVAFSLYELARATSSFSKKNAPKCHGTLSKKNPKNDVWEYKVKCFEKKSDPKGHNVSIKLLRTAQDTDINKLNIEAACDCGAWRFWGPDYNADKRKYLKKDAPVYDNVKPDANGDRFDRPDERDPSRRNLICKHIYVVSKIFEKFVNKREEKTKKLLSPYKKQFKEWLDKIDTFIMENELFNDREKKILKNKLTTFEKELNYLDVEKEPSFKRLKNELIRFLGSVFQIAIVTIKKQQLQERAEKQKEKQLQQKEKLEQRKQKNK